MDTGMVVDTKLCSSLKLPKTERPCVKEQCNIEWVPTEWSQCSVSCGTGIQTRDLRCRRRQDNASLSDYYCSSFFKPPTSQKCQMPSCDSSPPKEYKWVTGPWLDCSHPCGQNGFQFRKLYCYDKDAKTRGKHVNRSLCDKKLKPPRKRPCIQRRCGPTSCLDVKEQLRMMEDKIYILSIQGRNISIYCHGMDTAEPKEYVPLLSDEDNYSEIYDKRLLNPDSCPYQGRREEYCPCSNSGSDYGVTSFYKIRLNVTSLKVNTKDYTFARKRKGDLVPYGEAGDCYSKQKCPQGRFSIDLTGTGFMISHQTTWASHGPSSSILYEKMAGNRKVIGKCGGYCGNCSPVNGLKLDLLPP